MANVTIGFGLVLAALGLGGYVATGRTSLTALIPLAFGLLLGRSDSGSPRGAGAGVSRSAG